MCFAHLVKPRAVVAASGVTRGPVASAGSWLDADAGQIIRGAAAQQLAYCAVADIFCLNLRRLQRLQTS